MKTTEKDPNKKDAEGFINWFEIPVLNLDRAVNFYNKIYDIQMERIETNRYAMAFFPAENGVGGALVTGSGCVPSETGSLIYLNAGKNMEQILNKIEVQGGRIVLMKTEISDDAGHFALFIDSEGNKLALHSNTKNKSKTTDSNEIAKKTTEKRIKEMEEAEAKAAKSKSPKKMTEIESNRSDGTPKKP